MSIAGNFTQKGEYSNFNASGSHKVILDGEILQIITFENYPSSKFNIVELRQADEMYAFSPNPCWSTRTIYCDHSQVEVRDAVEPTCTGEGYTGDTYCKVCNELLEKGNLIEAKGHDIEDWKITHEASCEEEGSREGVCSRCKETISEVIPATDHYIILIPEKAATATENGYRAYYKCSVCGKLFRDAAGTIEIASSEVIPAAGSKTDTSTAVVQSVAESIPTLAVSSKISKPKAAKGAVTVKWKKASKKVQKKISGYQIQVATDASFTNVMKTVKAGKKASSKKIKLAKKTQYYVRIRAVKGSAFGAWSAVKAVKTK